MRRWFSALMVCFCLLWGHSALAEPRAFVAVETADIERSQAWYAVVFNAELVNSVSRPTFEQRVLRGSDIIVELIQRIPPRAPRTPDRQGLVKAGIVIDEFENRVEAWRAGGIAMHGHVVRDEALGLSAILLRDPDGNMIQIFGGDTD